MSRQAALCFVAIGAGIAVGIWFRPATTVLGYAGEIYTRLLDLCVVPMLVTLIPASLGTLRDSRVGRRLRRPLAVALVSSMLAASAIFVLAGVGLDLGAHLSEPTRNALGGYVHASAASTSLPLGSIAPEVPLPTPLEALVRGFIPANVFRAFSESIRGQLLVFAVVFGAGLMAVGERARHDVIALLEIVYAAFRTIFRKLLIVLPLGVFCGVAHAYGDVAPTAFFGMSTFLAWSIALFLTVIAASIAILAHRSRARGREAFVTVLHSMIIAFAARDAGAGVPTAVEGMRRLRYSAISSDAVTPLAISMGKFASIAYAAFAIAFAVSIYRAHLSYGAMLAVTIGAISAGIAAPPEGTSGVVLICEAIELAGLPSEALLVLFGVIDPIVKPFRAAANVAAGMSLSALILPARRRIETNRAQSPALGRRKELTV